MKNVHLIPTDKPSRLRLDDGELVLGNSKLCQNTLNYQYQNIYITNDEEIKEDWVLSLTDDESYLEVYKYEGTTYLGEDKKIILTTDQDLIADGVQEIDDEFLEWFVKNPSCEFVKVEGFEPIYGHQNNFTDILYKIIIPQEEPKTNLEKLPFPELVEELANYYKEVPLVEESKQETTLEEAACLALGYSYDLWVSMHSKDQSSLIYIEVTNWCKGAKWQAKRMCSEEDLHNAFYNGWLYRGEDYSFPKAKKEWLEQFKKK
jgi:hypothetical protein